MNMEFDSYHLHGLSQPSVIPVPRDSMPYSVCTCFTYIHTYRQYIHIHKKEDHGKRRLVKALKAVQGSYWTARKMRLKGRPRLKCLTPKAMNLQLNSKDKQKLFMSISLESNRLKLFSKNHVRLGPKRAAVHPPYLGARTYWGLGRSKKLQEVFLRV